MKELYELKEKLMDELKDQAKEIVKKPRMGAGDLDTINKMVKSIDRLCEILEMDEVGYSEAYSRDGNWSANMEGNYGRGSSYAGRRRDSRGRYSRDGRSGMGHSYGGDEMISKLENMMDDAKDEKERKAIRNCIREMGG